MRKNITRKDLLDAFYQLGCEVDEDPIEDVILKSVGIMPEKVIEWLKSVEKYNGESYYEEDGYLYLATFVDIMNDYAEEIEEEEIGDGILDYYDSSYCIAADFLLSEYCTDKQYEDFINSMYKEEVENGCENLLDDEEIAETRKKLLGI